MKITLTGATGFVGRRLVNVLLSQRHELTILTRNPLAGASPRYILWRSERENPPAEAFAGADAVIHLAGEPVAQRWSSAVKEEIRASRVDATKRLVDTLVQLPRRPVTMISASAIGYYGSRAEEELTESSSPGSGFLEDVCVGWEEAAKRALEIGVRVVPVRIGIVLGRNGGALAKMMPFFRAGVGGKLGSGKQWMSWIHIDDLVSMMVFALHHTEVHSPLNGVAPNPVSNAQFTRVLAESLGRPAILPVPGFALKLMYGEMAGVMLASQRVLPAAALDYGFTFKYPSLESAIESIVHPDGRMQR